MKEQGSVVFKFGYTRSNGCINKGLVFLVGPLISEPNVRTFFQSVIAITVEWRIHVDHLN